jgi:Flp pilus assembly protein TadG
MKTKRLAISLLKLGRGQSFRAGRLSGFGTGKRTLTCRTRAFGRDESGAVAIITAILMVVLLGFLSLAVDIGHLATVKNELQNAADAAALAGARALVFQSGEVARIVPLPDPPYCGQAKTWAQTTINQSDARNLSITTVQTGVWDWKTNTFTQSGACDATINAVHVEVQRNDVANQPVTTWFARIFGVDTVNSGARATAACGYLEGVEPGGWAPIALTQDFFGSLNEGDSGDIMFYPDQADNGGWCLQDQNPTPPELTNAIKVQGPFAIGIGDQVDLNNGTLVPGINAVQDQIAAAKADGAAGWDIILPVVNRDMTNQLNQTADVIGFAHVLITAAYNPNDKDNPTRDPGPPRHVIQFVLIEKSCLVTGSSGGHTSNLFATQPKLVQ